MNYEIINTENWDRTAQVEFYKDYEMPYVIMTADVDVTDALAFAHRHKASFNLVMVYICNKIVDSIINFRYRIIDGTPCLIPHNIPQVNHIPPGEENYFTAFCLWPCDDVLTFCRESHAHLEAIANGAPKDDASGRGDFINYSAIPWVRFNHMFRTIKKCGKDTSPKISFGKYAERDGRVLMPVSMQAHHALADGYHVGKFYMQLEDALANLDSFLA